MDNLFSYTRRDYESLRKEGLAKLPILSNGRLTDLNATDPGVILIDYMHALVDMVQFYQDHQALESFISTARERSNILRLADQLGYRVRSAKGSRVIVRFSLPYLLDVPLMIPKSTKLSTPEGLIFLTLETNYVPANTSYADVECVQGELASDTYEGTGKTKYSPINNGESASDQSFRLSAKNVDTDTIEIVDSSGRVWGKVDTLTFCNSTDRVFRADLQEDGTILLSFGDGQRGVVPAIGDVLLISYRVTEGLKGQIGSGKVTILRDFIFDPDGESVSITVTNLESSTGGSDEESEEEIKKYAPGVIKSQYRAVTVGDFEALASTVEGVSSAVAYDINSAPDICLHHEIKVIIVPKKGMDVSLLKQRVSDYLKRVMIPVNLTVISPRVEVVNVNVVCKRNRLYTDGSVEYEVTKKVNEYFETLSSQVNLEYNPNDLLIRLGSIPSILSVSSITPSTPVLVDKLSTINLGTLTVTVL